MNINKLPYKLLLNKMKMLQTVKQNLDKAIVFKVTSLT